MRIAVLAERKIGNSGGVERYVRDLMAAFLHAGDSVHLYTASTRIPPQLLAARGLQIHSQRLGWCPRKLRRIFFCRWLRRQLAHHQYDLVLGIDTPHSPDISICCGTMLGNMRVLGRPLINPLLLLQIHYERKKYRGARRCLAHSRMLHDELVRLFGMAPDQVAVLHPPTTAAFRPPKPGEKRRLRAGRGLEPDKKYLLFVSGNHHRKGLAHIIAALQSLGRTHCRLLVAGAGRGAFADLPFIHWLGHVDDMAALYRTADALVLQSVYEPFGLVVTEAQLSGLPVIVSDRVGATGIMDAHSGWITPHGDVAALAAAIGDFLANPAPVPARTMARIQDALSMERHIAAIKRLATDGPR